MRHGRSESNDLEIVASSPKGSLHGYGLTEFGRRQVQTAAQQFSQCISDAPIIYSSDFMSTLQTAQAVAERYGVDITTDIRLRERKLGDLDGASIERYYQVWGHDPAPDFCPFGAESLDQMTARMWSVVLDIEKVHRGKIILIVSHGDPLVGLNSYYMYGKYRPAIKYIGNAEIRRIDESSPFVLVDQTP